MMHDTRLIINVARRMIPQVRSQNSRRQVSAGVISKGVIAVVRMMLSRRKARKANGIEGRGSTRFLNMRISKCTSNQATQRGLQSIRE